MGGGAGADDRGNAVGDSSAAVAHYAGCYTLERHFAAGIQRLPESFVPGRETGAGDAPSQK